MRSLSLSKSRNCEVKMDSTDSNSFDKLWYCFSKFISMEQLLKFALTSKVILSYEIDYLNSFHDRLMQGLWKRSPNGCFYKMDDRHEKLAYVILNENYETEVEKSLEKFRKMSNLTGAQMVFDEMSEPVLCESQIVSSEENDAHNLFNANEMNVSDSSILQQEEVVCDADQVLDEMSESILSSNDSEIILFDKLSEPSLSSNIDQIAVTGADHSLLKDIDEIQPGVYGVPEPYTDDVPDYVRAAHKLFHTMPVPDFILEMANVAKTTQEENEEMADAHHLFDTIPEATEQANASQTKCHFEVINNEIAPKPIAEEIQVDDDGVQSTHEVHVEQEVGLEDKHQMFPKFSALDGPYFCDLLTLGANQEHFSKLRGVLYLADKLLLPDEHSDGNPTLKWSCLQVKNDSITILCALPSTRLAKNVLSSLMLSDLDWFMGLILSAKLGVKSCNTRAFESMVCRKTFFTFKELFSWGIRSFYCHWPWLEVPLGEQNFLSRLDRGCNSRVDLMSCIFIYDPGDLSFGATSSSIGFRFRYNSRAYMIIDHFADLHALDTGGNVNSAGGCKLWQGQLLYDSMLCYIIVLPYLVNDKILAIIPLPKWSTRPWLSTLEDKGDFEEMGKDMGSTLWWRMSALICIRDHLATNGNILTTMTCSCLCFDPGLTSVMSRFSPVYGTSIHSFTATNDNVIWPTRYMKTERHIRLEKSHLLCNAFFSYCKSRRGEVIQVFIWDPGNIMIALELLKSNKNVGSPRCWGASSGARANGCLFAIVEQFGCSTPLVLLENVIQGAAKFTFYQRLSNYVELVLKSFDLRRTTCSNKYGWRYFTLSCDMLIIGQISSLVFDLGGQKYDLSLVESLTSKFVQTTAIFLSCCLAQLNLLQSSDCADHEGAIVVFDPGGYGNGQKVMEQPKACQYGGGKRLKDKRNEDHQIYVFDPGGPLGRPVIDALVTNNLECVMLCLASGITCF